ncbi:MAG: ComF family protein [Parcubacteria group bacterium]|nr:ComF family protein [Parcubacteria group bacterium]
MNEFLAKAGALFLNVLFPPVCLNCREHLILEQSRFDVICDACFGSIEVRDAFFCPVCFGRLPSGKKSCHPKSAYLLAAAASYDNDAVQKLVWQLKYRLCPSAAIPLSDLLIRHLEMTGMSFENAVVVPLPLAPRRKKERGFNQSELLAAAVANRFGVPLAPPLAGLAGDALERTRNTRTQADLKWEQRKINVAGCFAVKNKTAVAGKNVVLIDDVYTSGATAGEAVKALKAAGAKKITVAVAAKA